MKGLASAAIIGILGVASPAFAQGLTTVRGLEVEDTSNGIQILIETESGSAPRFVPPSSNYRNVLVLDLLDAQLASGGDQSPLTRILSESNPAPGIQSISVERRTEDSLRVTIIGSEQLPTFTVQGILPPNQGIPFELDPYLC